MINLIINPSFWKRSAINWAQITKLYNKIMLSQTGLAIQSQRKEKPLISISDLHAKIPQQDYQDLVQWAFSIANELQLLPNTRCHMRVYFDMAVKTNQEMDVQGYFIMMITCLASAIKINETQSVAEQLTPQMLFGLASLYFEKEKYVVFEMKVTAAIEFSRYTTPSDSIDEFISVLPFLLLVKPIIQDFIQLACVHPSACEFTSQEIVLGAVLAVVEYKKGILEINERRSLQKIQKQQKRAELVKAVIIKGVNLYK